MLPLQAQAGVLETAVMHNAAIVQMQQETDNAVRWTSQNGYNDRVAYEFIRRCGWLYIDPNGNDWCEHSSAHKTLISTAYRLVSIRTVRLIKRYRQLH